MSVAEHLGFTQRSLITACLCWLAPALGFAWSENVEIAKGMEVYDAILSRSQPYNNDELQAYVDKVGQRLAAVSSRPNLNYTFTIIDEPAVNAYAAPGGYVFIDRGLLAYLNAEDQLAAVLAHEIAHITARHAEQKSRASDARKVFSGIASIATYLYTGSSDLANLPNYLGEAWIRGYGRKMELEADKIGARYMVRAGYDRNAMLEVIGLLKQQDIFQRRLNQGKRLPSYHGVFSTHPRNDQRLQKIIASAGQETGAISRADPIGDYLSMIDGLSFGQAAGEGLDQDNYYYSPSLNIQLKFPKNWQVSRHGDGLLSHPTAGPQAAYVLTKVHSLPKPVAAEQQAAYLEQVLNIKPIRQVTAVKTGDLSGIRADVDSGQPYQQQRQVAALFDQTRVFVFLGALTESVLTDEWQRTFNSILGSIRPLAEDASISVAKARIKLHQTGEGDSYTSLLPESTLTQASPKAIENQALLLKLLNGDYPRGEVGPGERIKVLH